MLEEVIADDAGGALSAKTRSFTILRVTEIAIFPQIFSDGDIEDWKREDWSYATPHPNMGAEFLPFTKDSSELVIVRDPKLESYQTCFKLFPDLQEYSLRDLFSKHPINPGKWRYRDRTDDTIIFDTGESFHSIEMEILVPGHALVGSVLLIGDRQSMAVFLVELTNNTFITKASKVDMVEKPWPIIEEANSKCDVFAMVEKSHILFVSPNKPMERAGKGTVQRRLTYGLYAQEIIHCYLKRNNDNESKNS